jgi:hypothetical protein
MATHFRVYCLGLLLALAGVLPAAGVELKISRQAIDRTLHQQLFSGTNARYYLKGDASSPCFTYADDPTVVFNQTRILVQLRIHARLGKSFGGRCIGIPLDLPVVVSLAPDAEGETVGFLDARIDQISNQRELNFLLQPFLSHVVPSSMKVNAAELLRRALADSTAASGYKVSLDRLRLTAIHVNGDDLVLEGDGDISVR